MVFSLVVLFVGVMLLVLGGVVKLKLQRKRYAHLPTPPLSSFLGGHIAEIKRATQRDGHMFKLYLKWTKIYGLVWCRFLYWKPGLVVLSVEGIKDMFITRGGLLKVQNSSLTYYNGQRFTGYGGVLNNVGGEVWRRKRQALDPAFHKKYLASLVPKMNEMTAAMIEELKRKARVSSYIDMSWYMEKSSLLLIASIGYDLDLSNMEEMTIRELLILLKDMMDGFFGEALDPTYKYHPKNMKHVSRTKYAGTFLRKLGHDALRKRRQRKALGLESPPDLLAHSIMIQENNPWYSDEEVVDDFVTFIVAGFETTSNAMSFALALLARYPGVATVATQEYLDQVERKRCLGDADLTQLRYLECIIKEVLRLYPPTSLLRRCPTQDTYIDSNLVPSGTQVMWIPYLQARLEQVWEDPLNFRPERFLDTTLPPLTYIPFLVGPRKCIGNNFAIMEMKVVLGEILRHFELEAPEEEDLKEEFKITLAPVSGTRLKLSERR